MSPKAVVALEKKPALFFTESSLADALAKLDGADPLVQMGEDEAAAFLERFVNPAAVVERRDEFASFINDAEAYAAGKLALAEKYRAQGKRVLDGVERMKAAAMKLMVSLKVRALPGNDHVIKLKDSRGAVKVVDESQIPAEFFRVKHDDDLGRIRELQAIVRRALALSYGMPDDDRIGEGALVDLLKSDEDWEACTAIVQAAESARRAVDKVSIQKEWKEHGETRSEVDQATGEITETPMIPGVEKEVTTTLVIE